MDDCSRAPIILDPGQSRLSCNLQIILPHRPRHPLGYDGGFLYTDGIPLAKERQTIEERLDQLEKRNRRLTDHFLSGAWKHKDEVNVIMTNKEVD